MSNTYAVGNVVQCPFCFTNRALTPTELFTFLNGGGLPAGVGVDQTTVKFDYAINNGPTQTLSGASISHDATGAYHANVTVTEAGDWKYRGYSLDGSGNPVAATATQHFTATAF
jgi:hypothetical protein